MKKLVSRFLIATSLVAFNAMEVYASSPVNFDDQEIKQSVDFAQLAYHAYSAAQGKDKKAVDNFNERIAQLKKDGYTIKTFEGETGHTLVSNALVKKSTMGVLAQKGDELVIAFRGTKDLADLVTDAYVLNGKLKKSRFLGEETGGVHAGFNLVFKSYQQQLTNMYLEALKSGAKNVTVVGHSMGAALAQMTALHLSKLTENRMVAIKVVSLNAPRVGSPNFAKKLNDAIGIANIARITKGEREGVSSLIPGIAGFKHAGINVVIPSESWNKLEDHKLSAFKNGAAEDAVKAYNENPKERKGIRDKIREGLTNFADGIRDAEKNAKSAFVGGFQAFRGKIAGLFGY